MGLGKQKVLGVDVITLSNYVKAKWYKHHDWIGAIKLELPNDIYIYMSYRTANLQKLHFIYLFNKYTY